MKLLGQVNPDLIPVHKTALEASLQPKINEITKESMNDPLVTLLGEACEIVGHKANGLTATAKLLRDELKNYFSTYSIEEVQTAVRMGVTGKLIEVTDLPVPIVSITNICKFINLYNEKIRKEALHQQKQWEEKNDEEKVKQKRDMGNNWLDTEIMNAWENFNENPETLEQIPQELRATYYRRIIEVNKANVLTKDVRDQIKAVAEARKDTFEELPKLDQKEMIRNRQVEKFNRERDAEVKIIAQSLALKEVFKLKK